MSIDIDKSLVTSKGQALDSVVSEFLASLKECESGSEQMNVLMDYWIGLEQRNESPESLEDLIKNSGHQLNIDEMEFRKTHPFPITRILLAYIGTMVQGNPQYAELWIGLAAYLFYKTHSQHEVITLEWFCQAIAKGKLLTWQQMFPWMLAFQTNKADGHRVIIFKEIPYGDYFTR